MLTPATGLVIPGRGLALLALPPLRSCLILRCRPVTRDVPSRLAALDPREALHPPAGLGCVVARGFRVLDPVVRTPW